MPSAATLKYRRDHASKEEKLTHEKELAWGIRKQLTNAMEENWNRQLTFPRNSKEYKKLDKMVMFLSEKIRLLDQKYLPHAN